MPKKKLPKDVQRIYLCADELNALLTLLDRLGDLDVESDNSILTVAGELKEKFLRYGKKYEKDGERFAMRRIRRPQEKPRQEPGELLEPPHEPLHHASTHRIKGSGPSVYVAMSHWRVLYQKQRWRGGAGDSFPASPLGELREKAGRATTKPPRSCPRHLPTHKEKHTVEQLPVGLIPLRYVLYSARQQGLRPLPL